MTRLCLAVLTVSMLVLCGCATSSNPSDPGSSFDVTGIWPPGAGPGTSITLTGRGFGDSARASQVIFFNTPATEINTWTDTEISVVVPAGILEWSKFDVFVRTGREDSDGHQFHGLPEGWRQISDNGSDDCYHLRWGYSNVLYFSSTRAEPTNFDVYRTYADNGRPTVQLTSAPGTQDQAAGTQTDLAYADQNGDDTDLRVHHGGSYTWATDDEYDDRWPDFNPYAGGDYELAFTKGVWNEVDEVVEYYIYGYPGYTPCEPITLSDGSDFQPSWSPDGTEIAFIRNSFVHKVEVATHHVTQLTSGDSASFPDWGSDGTILWVRGQQDIQVMDGDGKNQHVLADPPGFVMSAAWGPGCVEVGMILLLQGAMDIFIYDT